MNPTRPRGSRRIHREQEAIPQDPGDHTGSHRIYREQEGIPQGPGDPTGSTWSGREAHKSQEIHTEQERILLDHEDPRWSRKESHRAQDIHREQESHRTVKIPQSPGIPTGPWRSHREQGSNSKGIEIHKGTKFHKGSNSTGIKHHKSHW